MPHHSLCHGAPELAAEEATLGLTTRTATLGLTTYKLTAIFENRAQYRISAGSDVCREMLLLEVSDSSLLQTLCKRHGPAVQTLVALWSLQGTPQLPRIEAKPNNPRRYARPN